MNLKNNIDLEVENSEVDQSLIGVLPPQSRVSALRRLSLTITVDYFTNDANILDLKMVLEQIAEDANDNGKFTKGTSAQIESWAYGVKEEKV